MPEGRHTFLFLEKEAQTSVRQAGCCRWSSFMQENERGEILIFKRKISLLSNVTRDRILKKLASSIAAGEI